MVAVATSTTTSRSSTPNQRSAKRGSSGFGRTFVFRHWNGVAVGRVGRQVEQPGAPGGDGLADAIERYTNEAARLYKVCDRRLAESEYLADDYSIADIAVFPWVRSAERKGLDFADYPNVKRWVDAIEARPAVKRGLAVLADKRREGPMDEKQREVLFGKTQYRQG